MNRNLEQALLYGSYGWHIFRLTPGSNVPFKGSNGHKDATSNLEVIEKWWTEAPDANIGIATGAVSGIWVLDLDVKKGKNAPLELQQYVSSLDALEKLEIETKRVMTPTGGSHIYFKYDFALEVRNRAAVLGVSSGIDVRGDGGYVAAPPSVRQEGSYAWLDGAEHVEVADAPEWARSLYLFDARAANGKRLEARTPATTNGARRATNKVDQSTKVAWDDVLHVKGGQTIVVASTTVGHKYICRCPFHDDRSASAAFWRKQNDSGLLFCSACDTSWFTERLLTGAAASAAMNKRDRTEIENLVLAIAARKGEQK